MGFNLIHSTFFQVYVLLRLAKDKDDRMRTADLVKPIVQKDPRLASGNFFRVKH